MSCLLSEKKGRGLNQRGRGRKLLFHYRNAKRQRTKKDMLVAFFSSLALGGERGSSRIFRKEGEKKRSNPYFIEITQREGYYLHRDKRGIKKGA